MAPSSPQTHASQAPQNGRAPCVEQIPSPSRTERRYLPDIRVRDKNKAEGSDLEDKELSTSIPAQERHGTTQVDDFAPPARLSAGGRREARRKRLAAAEVSTNDNASSTRRKKTKTAQLNSDLIDDLQRIIGSSCSATNEFIIRPVGAEDLETAIRDCTQLFTESHGVPFVIKVTHWLREDPLNAVVWNSLKGKELKEAFVKSLE